MFPGIGSSAHSFTFWGSILWEKNGLGESSLEREMCHPSESKICPSCVHFQNMLAKSYLKFFAHISGCFKINKARGSDKKLELRQNMQENE